MNVQQEQAFESALKNLPLVAILRGITPDEIDAVFDELVAAGFKLIEVPLNSPDVWTSIERIAKRCPDDVVVGAGTVLDPNDVDKLATLNAPILITPNTNPEVITRGASQGLIPMIGCMTPSEALTAVRAGAKVLKLFPAARLGTGYFKDIRAVLPKEMPVFAVGGVDDKNMAEWVEVGIAGFGFGSNLYKPGRSAEEVGKIARNLIEVWNSLKAR